MPTFFLFQVAMLASDVVGGVILAAWIAFVLAGLAGIALRAAIWCNWVTLPPPNSAWRLRSVVGRRAPAKSWPTRHDYACAPAVPMRSIR